MSKKIRVIMISLMVLIFFGIPQEANASTMIVTTTADELDYIPGNGACSLREAIYNANYDVADNNDCPPGFGEDTITLPPGIYTLSGSANDDSGYRGDLDIWDNLTIIGIDPQSTIIQAGTASPVDDDCQDCVDRVMDILPGVTVSLKNITLRYGKAPDGSGSYSGQYGGGIQNRGALTLNNCVITHNRSGSGMDDAILFGNHAGTGGGIYTEGDLTLLNTWITHNRTGDGGDGGEVNIASWGGFGGGIAAYAESQVTIANSVIAQNQTGNGGHGGNIAGVNAPDGEAGGMGGGLYCYGCILTMVNTSILTNHTGDGGAGGDVTGGNGNGGDGGRGGQGAGLIISQSAVTANISFSRIHNNQTGQGGLGGSGLGSGLPGINGQRGSCGGVVVDYDSQATISRSTISDNQAYDGGGICSNNSAVTLLYHSTISGNQADNNGGGLFGKYQGTMELQFLTITNNTADSDINGIGDGGGFYDFDSLTMSNTIVAGNVSVSQPNDDCAGSFTSQDYNLLGIGDSIGCSFTPQTHDLVGEETSPIDPLLGVLADNGGLTLTHALAPSSPAADQIPDGVNNCNSGVTRDQRGYLRIAPCDIGAYEINVMEVIYLPLMMR